tara:strand:+ start:2595 stop:2792 length:198 start_codon:yes stop_codon:yes gene_type:complete
MGLSKAEKRFIDKLAKMHTDEWIKDEINRIRWECGQEERVTRNAVQKYRARQGIKKYKKGPRGED